MAAAAANQLQGLAIGGHVAASLPNWFLTTRLPENGRDGYELVRSCALLSDAPANDAVPIIAFVGHTGSGKSRLLTQQLVPASARPPVHSITSQAAVTNDVSIFQGVAGRTDAFQFQFTYLVDCEGSHAASAGEAAVTTAFGDVHLPARAGANPETSRRRAAVVDQVLPALVHAFADVIVYVVRTSLMDASNIRELNNFVARSYRSNAGQQAYRPVLILVRNFTPRADMLPHETATARFLEAVNAMPMLGNRMLTDFFSHIYAVTVKTASHLTPIDAPLPPECTESFQAVLGLALGVMAANPVRRNMSAMSMFRYIESLCTNLTTPTMPIQVATLRLFDKLTISNVTFEPRSLILIRHAFLLWRKSRMMALEGAAFFEEEARMLVYDLLRDLWGRRKCGAADTRPPFFQDGRECVKYRADHGNMHAYELNRPGNGTTEYLRFPGAFHGQPFAAAPLVAFADSVFAWLSAPNARPEPNAAGVPTADVPGEPLDTVLQAVAQAVGNLFVQHLEIANTALAALPDAAARAATEQTWRLREMGSIMQLLGVPLNHGPIIVSPREPCMLCTLNATAQLACGHRLCPDCLVIVASTGANPACLICRSPIPHAPPLPAIEAPPHALPRLLTFDAGGRRSLGSLVIVNALVQMANQILQAPQKLSMFDYFDLVGGSGSGGLIAVYGSDDFQTCENMINRQFAPHNEIVNAREDFFHRGRIATITFGTQLELDYSWRDLTVTAPQLPSRARSFVVATALWNPDQRTLVKVGLITGYRDASQGQRPRYIKKTQMDAAGQYIQVCWAIPEHEDPVRLNDGLYVAGDLLVSNPTVLALGEARRLWPGRRVTAVTLEGSLEMSRARAAVDAIIIPRQCYPTETSMALALIVSIGCGDSNAAADRRQIWGSKERTANPRHLWLEGLLASANHFLDQEADLLGADCSRVHANVAAQYPRTGEGQSYFRVQPTRNDGEGSDLGACPLLKHGAQSQVAGRAYVATHGPLLRSIARKMASSLFYVQLQRVAVGKNGERNYLLNVRARVSVALENDLLQTATFEVYVSEEHSTEAQASQPHQNHLVANLNSIARSYPFSLTPGKCRMVDVRLPMAGEAGRTSLSVAGCPFLLDSRVHGYNI